MLAPARGSPFALCRGMLHGDTEHRVLLTLALIAGIMVVSARSAVGAIGLITAGIGIASGTYEIVGMPTLEVQVENRA